MNRTKNLNNIVFFLFLLLPIAIITGPFFPDLIISVIGIIFLLILILNRNFDLLREKYSIFFFIWCAYLILNSLFSDNIYLSLQSSLFYFRYGFFVLAFIYILSTYENFINLFSLSFIIVYLFVLINSIVQYLFGVDFFGNIYSPPRISSVFGEEKILGSYLSRLLPILMALFTLNIKIKNFSLNNSYFILIILFVSNFIICLSGERTAFVFMILFNFMFILLNTSISFKKIILPHLIFSVLIIFVLFVTDNPVKNRLVTKTISQLTNTDENIYQTDNKYFNINFFSIQHQVTYLTSYKIFLDNKYFGIGPKMFRQVCKEERYKTYTSLDGSVNGCQTHPHHTYLQLLTETGIFGTVPVILIFFFICFCLSKQFYYKYFKKKYYLSDYNIFLLIALLITLWPFTPSGNFFNNWISIIYFFPVGFILSKSNKF